jgi:hypothetical protein
MELKDILAISGHGGLFKFISQGRNGIIVESFLDGKRMNAPGTAKISSLEDIAIFTEDEDVPLAKVLRTIREKEQGGPALNHKASNAELKTYFEGILPDYDRERVYVSDIKKLVSWYNILSENNLLDLVDEKPEKEEGEDADAETAKE